MLKLAYQYMKFYKSQTLAIFASIVLTAVLLSGVSSLMYSSQRNSLENNKMVYGSWHYCVNVGSSDDKNENTGEKRLSAGKEEQAGVSSGDINEDEIRAAEKDQKSSRGNLDADGMSTAAKALEELCGSNPDADSGLEQCGKMEIRDIVTKPYRIYFVNTDESYRQMAHREVAEGKYPEGEDEIAADYYTLGNLGFSGNIGDVLSLEGKDYILTGIIKSAWASESDEMEIFVGEDFAGQTSRELFYLRFDERKKLYKQLDAFLDKYQIPSEAVRANDEVTAYLRGEKPDSIYDIIKFALTDEKGNFTYVALKLQSEYNLALNGMILLLGIFSLFIIYSIFRISVSKRRAEYGIMQTLGIGDAKIGGTLILELWILFLTGYPLGCLLGTGMLKMLYHRFEGVFSVKTAGIADVGVRLSKTEQFYLQDGIEGSAFYVCWDAVFIGFLFLMAALAAVGFCTVYSMRRQSLRQVMSGDVSFIKSRKIYSLRNISLVNVVVRKFMFSNKKKVIGILLSLSIGGCIFLCTTYMVENLKIHAEMSMKSDDGLGSEYRVSLKSAVLSDTIPKEAVDELKKISGLYDVYASKYVLGELTIRENELEWDEYFKEQNQDSYFQQHFGGICVKKDNGTYGIKYDVYGYDDGMLGELQDFVIEGEIHPDDLKKGNKIIAAANVDGQGNYNFYGKHPGDKVVLRVPKELDCASGVLKFQSSKKHYREMEFEIAAIVSRALAKEDSYLNVEGWEDMQSVMMTNQQMSDLLGIDDYCFVNASLTAGADSAEVSSRILQKIQDVPKAVLRDYTMAIEMRKNDLGQQQLFFSGIAIVLLVISLFHIMNSMNYSILSRRREYGILRAMGITDSGFYKMILRTGILYGLLADLLVFLVYHIVFRKIMDYYMAHVVQFLHISAGVPNAVMAAVMALNLLIASAAVMLPANKMAKQNIIYEIKK